MQNTDWVSVLINWFPMLLLIGVWVWFLSRMRSGAYPKFQRDYLAEMKRQTEVFERIAAALDKSKS
jgi:ATP-dependent Zn protease